MSAFSSSKERSNDGSLNHQGYFSPPLSNSSPMGQMSSSDSGVRNTDSGPTPNQTPLAVSMSCSWRTPAGVPSPFSGHQWSRSSGYKRGRSFGRGSSNTDSGRGNSHRVNNMSSPGSGRTNGRGRGVHNNAFVSAREQPQLFYKKAMVEDPWKFLKPAAQSSVILKALDSGESWLPKSVNTKKAKNSEDTAGFSFQSSLADCLSLAFEEAVKDVANT